MSVLSKMKPRNEKKSPVSAMAAALIEMYLVSILMLLVLAFLLLQMDLSESVVKIGIIVVYIASGFVGGFLIGRQMGDKKYLWGILAGLLYFAVLVLLSFFVKKAAGEMVLLEPMRIFTTMILCMISGMSGGMLS